MDTTSPFECFSNHRQDFMVCTTIHKARNLCAFNADTYVQVTLGKKHKTTKVFQNSENPYFNQVCSTLSEMLRLTMQFEVKRKACCKKDLTMGELLIDLGTVWNQPGHNFFKKWGQLECCLDAESATDSKGYLQIDLAIVSKYEPPMSAVFDGHDFDDIETNLLLPETPSKPILNVKYSIIFYNGIFNKKSDYLVQVSFAGMNAKTKLKKGTKCPNWNEELHFLWFHPSLSQTFLIRLMVSECMHLKTMAEYEIHLDEISFLENIPSFGPTFIQLYDSSSHPTYFGRILVEIRTDRVETNDENIEINRSVLMKPAPPIDEKSWWATESFILEGLIWQGDFLHCNKSNLKIVMKLGELTTNILEVILKGPDGLKYFMEEQPYKAIHTSGLFPDNRLKFECDHFLHELENEMITTLDNFKLFELKNPCNEQLHSKCLKAIIMSFQKMLLNGKYRLGYNGFKQLTDWDKNRLKHLKEFYDKIMRDFENLRQNLKTRQKYLRETVNAVHLELVMKAHEINALRNTRTQDNWPDLKLYLLSGGKEIAVCKLNALDFVHSQRHECAGMFSRQRRNFVFKEMNCTHPCRNCGCVAGKIDGWIWIGTEAERNDFSVHANAWECVEPFYYKTKEMTTYDCRLYIHQAKVRPGSDKTGLCDAKLRLSFGSLTTETSTISASLSPVWDEVVSFEGLTFPGPIDLYRSNPPLVAVEIFDMDSLTASDNLGCGLVQLAVKPFEEFHGNSNYEKVVEEEECSPKSPDKSTLQRFKSIAENHSKGTMMNLRNIVRTKIAVRKLKEVGNLFPPPLKWVALSMSGTTRVEVLLSGEMVKREMGGQEMANVVKNIPTEICPIMKKYKLEVIFAGLRNCHKLPIFQLAGRYKIKIMLGDLLLYSGPSGSKLKNSVNFLDIYASGVVSLPEQCEYWPPIIVTHVDCSRKSQEITLGAALISRSAKYLTCGSAICKTTGDSVVHIDDGESTDEKTPLIEHETKERTQTLMRSLISKVRTRSKANRAPRCKIDELEYTWWTKFYNSLHKTEDFNEKHILEIFPSELEKQPEFNGLQDWAVAVPMVHGMKHKKNSPPREDVYCVLKSQFKITSCKKIACSSSHPCRIENTKFEEIAKLMSEVRVIVRVYIVQGLQLRSRDRNNQSDAFVKMQLGAQKISDRANYVPNQSNPIFGKRFQFETVIPRDHILNISVYDKGADWDTLIGCTSIDLEDRYRTRHRATVGIANEFNRTGYNMWRHPFTPYEILKDICKQNEIGPPFFHGNTVEVGGVTFRDSTKVSIAEDLQERLSVSALKRLEEVPVIGYKLVPEHVETRSLYRKDRPGLTQGKLQLWIELFDPDHIPPPIDITPTPAQVYELRVIVYNTADVIMAEKNVFGKSMTDIYVKGWLQDNVDAQDTDIHHRSLTGDGNFNWRMVFPFKYSKAEDMMVIMKKGGILEQYEIKQPPILYLQIWDDDALSCDDFLGAVELNLSNFPDPPAAKRSCSLQRRKGAKYINIFNQKTVRGWLPCRGKLSDGKLGATGKIEVELQVLTEAEAFATPVGLGRSPPNALPEPNRPDTSFNPFTNPLKSLKHILMPALRRVGFYCCLAVIIILLIIGIFTSFQSKILALFTGGII